jgi:hypothetical protein
MPCHCRIRSCTVGIRASLSEWSIHPVWAAEKRGEARSQWSRCDDTCSRVRRDLRGSNQKAKWGMDSWKN